MYNVKETTSEIALISVNGKVFEGVDISMGDITFPMGTPTLPRKIPHKIILVTY